MSLLEFFLRGVEFLNTQPEFKNVLIKGKIMRLPKKQSYYSTICFAGYEGNNEVYGEATIYINLRDLKTKEGIIKALAHEANHITNIKVGADYYLELLHEKFKEDSC
jgi:hypothetical protein